MWASTLKGLIIHTADDLGNPGPDYSYGWGLMNTVSAAELINNYANGNTIRLYEGAVSTNQGLYLSPDLVKQGIDPIRVTLCWTDPPASARTGNDDRTPVLVNNLDLEVWGSDGTTYYPYSLDYAHPSDNATTNGPNHVDNVEQVYIEHPVPGVMYAMAVYGTGIVQNAEQDFSLLISGTDDDTDGDGMTDDWELSNFLTATGAVATADADGDGEDNGSEYISGHDPNDASSFFQINSWQAVPSSGQPFIVNWEPRYGRIYNVQWSSNLLSNPFSDISGNLAYPANSFTDTVMRAGSQQFYRIDVQLAP